jgi:transcriptional regulator with XRE-family HTH domain
MTHISSNLRLIRLVVNLTQSEFGKLFNATKPMVSSYEGGRALPDQLYIQRVARYAGVTEEQLMNAELHEEDLIFYKQENGQDVQNGENAAESFPYTPPTKAMVELNSMVQLLMAKVAFYEAERLGIPLEKAIDELEKTARLNAYQLLKEMKK